MGGWRPGTQLSSLMEEPPVLWAVPSWLPAAYLVGKPRLGLSHVAICPQHRFGSGWDRLLIGCRNWFEEWEEPESGQALVTSGRQGRKDSRS